MINDKLNSVLFIYANPIIYPVAPPYGLEILSSFVLEAGYQPTIVSPFHASRTPILYLARILEKIHPLIVGISFRNYDEAGFSYTVKNPPSFLPHLKEVIKILKDKLPRTPLLLGGSGFSISPERILSEVDLEFGVKGPGEQSIVAFIRMAEKAKSRQELKTSISLSLKRAELQGFVFREDNSVFSYGSPQVGYVEPIHRFVDEGWNYAGKLMGGTVPIRMKIGCPKKCSYCVVPSIEPLLLRQTQSILGDIQFFVDRSDTNRFFLSDSESNLPSASWFESVLSAIIGQFQQRIRWMGYLYPTKDFTEKTALLMKASGCQGVSYTVDSLDDKVLGRMLKQYRRNDVLRILDILERNSIPVQMNLLMGGPGETSESIEQQVNLIRTIATRGIRITVNIGLRVYDNTPLEVISMKNEFKAFLYISKYGKLYCSPKRHNILGPEIALQLGRIDKVQFTEQKNHRMSGSMRLLWLAANSHVAGQFEKSLRQYKLAIKNGIPEFRGLIGMAHAYASLNNWSDTDRMITKLQSIESSGITLRQS